MAWQRLLPASMYQQALHTLQQAGQQCAKIADSVQRLSAEVPLLLDAPDVAINAAGRSASGLRLQARASTPRGVKGSKVRNETKVSAPMAELVDVMDSGCAPAGSHQCVAAVCSILCKLSTCAIMWLLSQQGGSLGTTSSMAALSAAERCPSWGFDLLWPSALSSSFCSGASLLSMPKQKPALWCKGPLPPPCTYIHARRHARNTSLGGADAAIAFSTVTHPALGAPCRGARVLTMITGQLHL